MRIFMFASKKLAKQRCDVTMIACSNCSGHFTFHQTNVLLDNLACLGMELDNNFNLPFCMSIDMLELLKEFYF